MYWPFSPNVSYFIFIVLGFVLIKHWLDSRTKQASERLRVLEDALKRGNLDDVTREELVEALTGRRVKRSPAGVPMSVANNSSSVLMKIVAFVGWISFCLGMALVIVVNNTRGYPDLEVPATILSCVGFGLVTFPFVIRELQNSPRRHAGEHNA